MSPVLETVTLVLERAERPMRVREIHAAAEKLAGGRLLWTSVKAALSANVMGERPRFHRLTRGAYETVGNVRGEVVWNADDCTEVYGQLESETELAELAEALEREAG